MENKARFNGVQNWMYRHVSEFETATQLAEGAAAHFDIYENNRDYTIPERVFELAAIVLPTE